MICSRFVHIFFFLLFFFFSFFLLFPFFSSFFSLGRWFLCADVHLRRVLVSLLRFDVVRLCRSVGAFALRSLRPPGSDRPRCSADLRRRSIGGRQRLQRSRLQETPLATEPRRTKPTETEPEPKPHRHASSDRSLRRASRDRHAE